MDPHPNELFVAKARHVSSFYSTVESSSNSLASVSSGNPEEDGITRFSPHKFMFQHFGPACITTTTPASLAVIDVDAVNVSQIYLDVRDLEDCVPDLLPADSLDHLNQNPGGKERPGSGSRPGSCKKQRTPSLKKSTSSSSAGGPKDCVLVEVDVSSPSKRSSRYPD